MRGKVRAQKQDDGQLKNCYFQIRKRRTVYYGKKILKSTPREDIYKDQRSQQMYYNIKIVKEI